MQDIEKKKKYCILIGVGCALLVFITYWIAGVVPPQIPDYTGAQIDCEENDFITDGETTATIILRENQIETTGTGVTVTGNEVTIKKSGCYYITGKLDDGSIIVSVADKGIVYLILDNAEIKSDSEPAIYVLGATKVVITMVDDTLNTISATASGGLESAIYSETDLTFNGSGTLKVYSENGIAINCSTYVRFISGCYEVVAKENAVKAEYGVFVKDGNFTLESGADTIKTTTTGQVDGEWIGVVDIEGGTINIISEGDGINAGSAIRVDNGTLNVMCGGGSSEIEVSNQPPGRPGMEKNTVTESSTVSTKGLKANTGIYITGGEVTIDCVDDAIHSDGDVTIRNGRIWLLSNGDGIQGKQTVNLFGGEIYINRCMEGVCGRYITVSNGMVDIVASDDGINATNNDNPIAALGMEFEILGTGGKLFINGGTIHILTSGDGMDANGSIVQTEGTVYIVSTSNGVEAPIDYTGTYQMTGGTLFAFGSGGMMQQTISEDNSTVGAVTIAGAISKGSMVKLTDTVGEVISIESECDCSSLIIASSKLSKGMEITASVDEVTIGTGKISKQAASIGETVSSFNGIGARPEDAKGEQRPGGQFPSDMGNNQNEGNMRDGKPGFSRPFSRFVPIIVIFMAVLLIVRKRRKRKKEVEGN